MNSENAASNGFGVNQGKTPRVNQGPPPNSVHQRGNGGISSLSQASPHYQREKDQFQLSELGDWYYEDLEKKLNLKNTTHLAETDKLSNSGGHQQQTGNIYQPGISLGQQTTTHNQVQATAAVTQPLSVGNMPASIPREKKLPGYGLIFKRISPEEIDRVI